MSEYPSMYDAAIEYAKKGFAVFPLKYRDKVPLTRNGCTLVMHHIMPD